MNEKQFLRLAKRTLMFAPLLICIALTGAHAQSGRPTPTPQRPARVERSTQVQIELPSPIAETPVLLVSGQGEGLQMLSFTTPDANFERIGSDPGQRLITSAELWL